MGCMQLNQISAMTEIKLNLNDDEAWMEVMMGHGDLVEPHATLAEISQESWQKARQARKSFRAFDLDSSCQSGKVALLYCQGNDNPQIWFQDLSCKWYFLCKTFSDYFRLLVMHLGLPNWHYSFTEVGLDPASKHWFRLLSPERLAIDLEAARELNAHRRAMRGEVVGARNEGGVDDVQAGGADAAEEGATSVGALQLDLASLDQMRDLNPKKKAAQGALASIQQDNNDRWVLSRHVQFSRRMRYCTSMHLVRNCGPLSWSDAKTCCKSDKLNGATLCSCPMAQTGGPRGAALQQKRGEEAMIQQP